MSKTFKVQIAYGASVDVRIEADTEAGAKALAEQLSLYESTVLMGIGSDYAETITTEQEVLVLEIEEYTAPDQFAPERLEALPLKIIEILGQVLEEQIGKGADPLSSGFYDVTWQEHLGLSDQEYKQLQEALPRLSLEPEVQS